MRRSIVLSLCFMTTTGSEYEHLHLRKEMEVAKRLQRGKTSSVRMHGGATSSVRMHGGVVVKKSKEFHAYNLIAREVCVLKRLQKFPWCPRLLQSTEDSITLSFVGNTLTAQNAPSDSVAQFKHILGDMASAGVRHNDILFPCSATKHDKHEVMVLDGRLSLVDFGWATTDGAVPCNVSNKRFLPGWEPCDDATMLEVLDGVTPLTRAHYRDAKRKVDSQSEAPHFEIGQDSNMRVRGYQQYDLYAKRVVAIHSYASKFNWLRETLRDLRQTTGANTFTDIGCSAGLTSLLAQEVGYSAVVSLDHDTEYIDMLKNIVEEAHLTSIVRPRVFSFGEPFETKSDVVFVGALIHWVFTCTANFGEFDAIMDYLLTVVSKTLLIEWVDPADAAIRFFHHDKCGAISKEPYNVSRFERSLRRVGAIRGRWPIPGRNTRVIYSVLIYD